RRATARRGEYWMGGCCRPAVTGRPTCAASILPVEQRTALANPSRSSRECAPISFGSEARSSSWGKAQAESRPPASTTSSPTGWRGITEFCSSGPVTRCLKLRNRGGHRPALQHLILVLMLQPPPPHGLGQALQ